MADHVRKISVSRDYALSMLHAAEHLQQRGDDVQASEMFTYLMHGESREALRRMARDEGVSIDWQRIGQ